MAPRAVFHPCGGVAQLGEHLLCKQGVVGSNPIASIPGPPGALSWGIGLRRAGLAWCTGFQITAVLAGAPLRGRWPGGCSFTGESGIG
jgi:hypothetical protein